MDDVLQTKVLAAIKDHVEKHGMASIKDVAERVTFDKVSLAEQKRLAKLLVKENPFVTELTAGEIFVKRNKQYDPALNFSGHESLIKWLIATLAGMLIYIIFHVIVPGLH